MAFLAELQKLRRFHSRWSRCGCFCHSYSPRHELMLFDIRKLPRLFDLGQSFLVSEANFGSAVRKRRGALTLLHACRWTERKPEGVSE